MDNQKTSLNIVLKKCSNTYSVELIPEGSSSRINQNNFFVIYPVGDHYVMVGPNLPGYDNDQKVCLAVGHNESEINVKAKDKIREYVSDMWSYYRRRGIERVLDNTGEGILDGWKEPVVYPDD